MKVFLLACLFAGLIVAEGNHHGRRKMKGLCNRLEKTCQRGGTRRNMRKMTYCSWDKENKSYETVTKHMSCLMHALKCSDNKDLAPLHTGKCGNCTQANVCGQSRTVKGMGGKFMGRRKICDTDGNKYKNKCEFAMARCEAHNEDGTKLYPKPCEKNKKERFCEKLEAKCNNGRSMKNVTYCAWNEDEGEYETITRGMACFYHSLKCRKEGEKMPLHKGKCGNCSRENICRGMSLTGKMLSGDDDDDDDDDDDGDDDNDSNSSDGSRGRAGLIFSNRKMGGKRFPQICDQNGKKYITHCAFVVARCKKYAEDEEELTKARCQLRSKFSVYWG